MKENPESLHYQCDSLRKQQEDLLAMKDAESQLFADLSTNFDIMQKLLDEIMDRWAALNGPAQAIEFENVMKEYKDRIKDLNVLLEKHTSKSMPEVQAQLDNLKLENDKLTREVKRLQQESTQKEGETHLNLVKKLEGQKQKISNQTAVLNKLQKTVDEQKEKLQAQEHLMDELTRAERAHAHEEISKLKMYTEKFKPLIVAGAKLRNRRMEKTKPWKDQDTRVKEIGNAAAHDADVIADALLYESDLPFPRRIDSEYFEAHYGYDHRNVIETFSPKLSQVISWNATMKTIATYGCVDDDDMSKFKEAFAKIMLVSYGDDDFDMYVTETYEGVSLYKTLEVEFDKVVAINSERRAGSKKENNVTSRKWGRNSTKKAHLNV
ncbi:hypothetical protein HYALB_00001552 [Hymenoscyphus albidus]|uniref:Uncharacterized protein n=1 Tax=Hymenoscyphus albidus TaxID=595503 RepID=A0A9N9LDN1_9HELO|nr:hypothetical protein HYALB_00001552 [Hymenoscyphus albidus]